MTSAAAADRVAPAVLVGYLEAVVVALRCRDMDITAVHTVEEHGLLRGQIQLGRDVVIHGAAFAAVHLNWTEFSGWEVALRVHGDEHSMPWRFLHAELVPTPTLVAAFTHALLRGQDLGMPYPAQFRIRGDTRSVLLVRLGGYVRAAAGCGPVGEPESTVGDARRGGRSMQA